MNPSQTATGTSSASTTLANTPFGAGTAAGSLIVVCLAWSSDPTVSSIVDNVGNTYTLIDGYSSTIGLTIKGLFYASANSTAGATTVTVTTSTSVTGSIVVREYATGFGIDQHAVTDGSGGGTISAASITPTHNNEIVIGWLAVVGVGVGATAGSGFGNYSEAVSTTVLIAALEDKTIAAIATQTATFAVTGTSQVWLAGTVSYEIQGAVRVRDMIGQGFVPWARA